MTPDEATEILIEHDSKRHLSTSTISWHQRHLKTFAAWCRIHHLDDLRDATEETLAAFHSWLRKRRRSDGRPFSADYINRHVLIVRRLFKLLADQNFIMDDVGKFYPPLHSPRALPRGIMTEKQVMKMLRQPNLNSPAGFRDRAILETLYSTALRSSELCNLSLYDVDIPERIIRVIQGKGKKDRVVPIGKTAASYLAEYLKTVRPVLLGKNASACFFLTASGFRLRTSDLSRIVKKHRDAARLPDNITPHSLRHTCATEMLRGGASLRHVQELLGHTSIETTQIYTHVVKTDLKRVHARTAPSEQRKKIEPVHFDPEMASWHVHRNGRQWEKIRKRVKHRKNR